METALLKFFVLDDNLYSTCDFNLMFTENDVSIYEVVRVEKKIPLSDLEKYSSCFLSGTSPKILPVSRLNAKTFDVNDHRVRFLMDIYDDLCKAEKENFQW